MVVRSSACAKRDLMAANTVGIIDSDYYDNPDNEGNIHIALRNLKPALELTGFKTVVLASGERVDIPVIKDLREQNTVVIQAGERVVQGIFLPVLEADSGFGRYARRWIWQFENCILNTMLCSHIIDKTSQEARK